MAQLNAPLPPQMGVPVPGFGPVGAGMAAAEAVPTAMGAGSSIGEQELLNQVAQIFERGAKVAGHVRKILPGAGKIAGTAGILELLHRGLR